MPSLSQELVELAAPFGNIVQSKLNVGPNRNQAFIEFTDVNLAVQMINFFATSSEPAKVGMHITAALTAERALRDVPIRWHALRLAVFWTHQQSGVLQVRGKTVYLQYSTRDQIINSTTRTGEAAGNVILVSLENLDVSCALPCSKRRILAELAPTWSWSCSVRTGCVQIMPCTNTSCSHHIKKMLLWMQPNVNVTLDTLHLVFSAFGTVQKIATFEKQSGFQALVQYPDAQTAEQVCVSCVRGHCPASGCCLSLKGKCTTCFWGAV